MNQRQGQSTMRINQSIAILQARNSSLNGVGNDDDDNGDDGDDMQLSGTSVRSEQDMDIHKIINDSSNAVVAAASSTTTAPQYHPQQQQQPFPQQEEKSWQSAVQLADNAAQLAYTNNEDVGVIVEGAMTGLLDADTNSADFMGDAFGELCLSAINCGNSTDNEFGAIAGLVAGGVGGEDQNLTRLFFDPDENFTGYCMNHVDNLTYLNISCEFELEYATPLYGFCIPFLLFVTVTANLLIVIVLSRRSMATPTNSVLMGMALCDMFTLLCPAPGLIYMLTLGNHNRPLSSVAACHAWIAFYETIPNMFHTASIWLTLALAVQRYIYVCHPPLARTWCTMPRVRKCIFAICTAAFLHQSTRFFDREFTTYTIFWEGQWIEVCKVDMTPWVREVIGTNLYFTTYFVFRVIFVHLVPCVCLVALNCLLFRAMKQAQNRRENLFRENRKKECKKLRDSNCTTLMLIVVVTVFLIVEIPLAVLTLLHIISSVVVEFLDYHLVSICILFANFALIVSYPINFAIYCGMSRQFRETFKEIFLRGSLKLPNKSVTAAASTSRYSLVNGPRTCTNETVL